MNTAGTVTYDVRIWAIKAYKGKRGTTYTVRWVVAGQGVQRTFATKKLAESFLADLTSAARNGSPFDVATGLPVAMVRATKRRSWLEHAGAFVDMKWPRASPRHRKNIAEALTTVTLAVVGRTDRAFDLQVARSGLRLWAFNSSARAGLSLSDAEPPEQYAEAVRWIGERSPDVTALGEAELLRKALDGLAVKLDGTAAAPATIRRKKSAFYSALDHAVELGLLDANPIEKIKWSEPEQTTIVDRRVVANPEQARRLIAAVGVLAPPLEAFFGCLYFAALRPSEAARLDIEACTLPEAGWGSLLLSGSSQHAGSAWTDTGEAREDRSLKHRPKSATRAVPACPELVSLLKRHIKTFGTGPAGRLFVSRVGRFGRPLPAAYSNPVSSNTYARVWQRARVEVLTAPQVASKLAGRPYDLRHAAVSLWLNAGVPPTQVAEWAGHSVEVLLRVYAKCLDGQDEFARRRVEHALGDVDS